MSEADQLQLGKITLRVLQTPGHTPEYICLQIFDAQQGEEPFALFAGDKLFNLDVGRPDLLGIGTEKKQAAQLYHSLFDKLLPLGDRIEIYPCHGSGSACGRSIGDRKQSTIGNERVFSQAFKERTESGFVEWILSGMPELPIYYSYLKKVNAKGAKILGCVPTLLIYLVRELLGKMKIYQ